jgi:hypothetical protein
MLIARADAARMIPVAVVAMKLLLSIMVISPSTYTSNERWRNRQAQNLFLENRRARVPSIV